METRKVQRLGPSTLAMTLPAEWAGEQDVEKGDEVSLRMGSKGTLTVMPESVQQEESEAVIHAQNLDADAVERAIVAQYVLGRRIIHVEVEENGTLDSAQINAVYNAETQLMGLGVIEETPERIAIRCSVDPEDFSLDNLLGRLESTGSTMRNEAIKSLARGDPDLAQRALNRERQANKIFVLLLRLEIVLETEGHTLEVDDGTMRRIRELTDDVNAITELGVRAAVERDYDMAIETRERFAAVRDRETEILDDLEEMPNEDLLRVREVLVSIGQTAQYAVRIAEIATNLSLNENSEHVSIE
ncbi:histidine kinase [Halobacteriales archaeon QS_9_70_65]|nr:MAG: histidine kinase [Halobacteriales archaeon QS_9_70_65]